MSAEPRGTSGPSAVRTVDVLPPSRSDEGTWVFLSAAFVVLCVIYVVAFQRLGGPGDGATNPQATTLPFQVLFRDLPNAEQRVFRQMQEGLGEAMAARNASGAWPAVEALAGQGVPPFASDVLDKTGLRWTRRRDGLTIEYVGTPAGAESPAYLILIREPDPVTGEKPTAAATVDEEHQLLADGKLLHVTYWKSGGGSVPQDLIPEPALLGWNQIRVKSPFEEATKP